MTSPFDALAGIRKATRETPTFAARPKVVRGPSLETSVTELETGYSRDPIYRAERRLNRKITSPYILRDINEMQDYVNAVLQRAYPQYSRATWQVTVRSGDTPGLATHQAGVIYVPGPIRQVTLLHELAHHLVGSDQGHNDIWIQAFLYLIDQEMGPDIKQKLLDELN
jgi:hypothetical protein